jgi:TolA-binding protein
MGKNAGIGQSSAQGRPNYMKPTNVIFPALVLASTMVILSACGGGSKEQPQTTEPAQAASGTTEQMLQSMQTQINNLQTQVNNLQQQLLQLQSQ